VNHYKKLIEKRVSHKIKIEVNFLDLCYSKICVVKNVIEDVLVRMMDERTSETARNLYGHSGPIYGLSFSPDRNLLLSSSEDTTSKHSAIYSILLNVYSFTTCVYLSNPIK